jgi:hypothetical protein
MVKSIVSDNAHPLKDGYPTAHEALCARLQQASSIADLAVTQNVTDRQLFNLMWSLSDSLKVACTQCESLTADDFAPEG